MQIFRSHFGIAHYYYNGFEEKKYIYIRSIRGQLIIRFYRSSRKVRYQCEKQYDF